MNTRSRCLAILSLHGSSLECVWDMKWYSNKVKQICYLIFNNHVSGMDTDNNVPTAAKKRKFIIKVAFYFEFSGAMSNCKT